MFEGEDYFYKYILDIFSQPVNMLDYPMYTSYHHLLYTSVVLQHI